MNAHGRRQLNPENAEHLLNGHPAAQHVPRLLAERLTAASTAAFPGELAGEHTAVAAFLAAADVDLAPQHGRRSMIKTTLVAKLLTVKAAAVAVAAVSAGGVTLAASTGVLPNPLNQVPENPGHSVSTPAQTESEGPNASPSLIGLCTAYVVGDAAADEEALTNPAFSALVDAAGGVENIESYCAGLGVTESTPGNSGNRPTDHPTGPPSGVVPSGLPTPSHPTGPPSGRTTGPPSGLPTTPNS
jgi:hypothetical protein